MWTTIHRSVLYQTVRGNVSLLYLLLRLELTPSLEPLMSEQWVIKWGPGREWSCGARTGCSPYETRFSLYETELRSPLPTSEFYEGLRTEIFTFVTSLRNLSRVTVAGTKLLGQELHWCKRTRLHRKTVMCGRCSCAMCVQNRGRLLRTVACWKGDANNSVRFASICTDPEARVRFSALPEKKGVGLERGPLSLVSKTEELLDRKVAAPV
jgi:hypothetical protein